MIRSHACIHSLSSIQEYYTLQYLIQYVHTNCLEVPNSNCLQELLDKNGWSACRKTRAYYTYARSMQFTLVYLQIALSRREGSTTTYLNTSLNRQKYQIMLVRILKISINHISTTYTQVHCVFVGKQANSVMSSTQGMMNKRWLKHMI